MKLTLENFLRMNHILVLIILSFTQTAVVDCNPAYDNRLISNQCGPNQKQRYDYVTRRSMCCTTTICDPGQKFQFCPLNNGYDTCQNCPKGYTHSDTINTAIFDSEIDPCVLQDECNGSGQKLINGICICDLTNGYYGRDKNNCGIDDGSCKKQGYELTPDGDCVPCDSDHFKSENSYELCGNKTSCSVNQEVEDIGSTTRDRTCRAKTMTAITTLPKPTIEVTDLNTEATSSKNNTAESDSVDINEEDDQDWKWIVGVVCGGIFIGAIIMIYNQCLCRNSGPGEAQSVEGGNNYNLNCCTYPCYTDNRKETHIRAENLIVGDQNEMLNRKNSGHDDVATPSDEGDSLMTDYGSVLDQDINSISDETVPKQLHVSSPKPGVSHPLLDEDTVPEQLYGSNPEPGVSHLMLDEETDLKQPHDSNPEPGVSHPLLDEETVPKQLISSCS